jgi:hypothetical protein
VKKLLQSVVLLAAAAGIAWWYRQSANQASADAWAAGTDRVE